MSASLEADACISSPFEETLSTTSECIAKMSGGSGTGSPSPRDTGWFADGIFLYTSVDFYFVYIPWNIIVSTVISMHPPNFGHSKRYTTSISIHPSNAFEWKILCIPRVVLYFCSGPLTYGRNKRNTTFYCWRNRRIPWGKCHVSANIAGVIRVIYAFPGQVYKYTR